METLLFAVGYLCVCVFFFSWYSYTVLVGTHGLLGTF